MIYNDLFIKADTCCHLLVYHCNLAEMVDEKYQPLTVFTVHTFNNALCLSFHKLKTWGVN